MMPLEKVWSKLRAYDYGYLPGLVFVKLFGRFGLSLTGVRPRGHPDGFSDTDVDLLENDDFDIIAQALPHTLTTPGRLAVLIDAVQYVVDSNVPGDIVECGVWQGGSMMAVALKLAKMNVRDRDLFLYDTYDEGMPLASAHDVNFRGDAGSEIFSKFGCPLETTQQNLQHLGYPHERIRFVKGRVEDTIPQQTPETVAILRLDTDFYESTRHELEYLFPRLSRGGVFIVDDYGHWKGARKAVDEYFDKHDINILLTRIDYTCRVGIKNS